MLHERLGVSLSVAVLALWLALAGGVLFIVMAVDKSRARRGARRVPERTLLGLALLGGAPLGVLAMAVLRHKTRHARFRFGFPILAVAWLAAVAVAALW